MVVASPDMNVIGHDFFTIKTKNSALCDSKR
jgi:hypothetical protein